MRTRINKIPQINNNKFWWGCGTIETLVHPDAKWDSLFGREFGIILKIKLKIEIPYNTSVSVLGIYPTDLKTHVSKNSPNLLAFKTKTKTKIL